MPQMDWFETWFGTPFYHALYDKRSDKEAEDFIERLIKFLAPRPEAVMLDLACGAGRHARSLAQLGYDVTGIDISAANIALANKYAQDGLRFYIQDMRHIGFVNHFHFVFNLFTSFGYFENPYDNIRVAQAIVKALKPDGKFIIDYLNAKKATDNLVAEEQIQKDTLNFNINRKVENGYINKYIRLQDEQGGEHLFREQVQLFSPQQLTDLFAVQGLKRLHIFGDYQLSAYDEATSDRMILIFEK